MIRTLSRGAGALLTLWAALAQPPQDTTAIVGAVVIDGAGSLPTRATVLIRGKRIAAVGPEVSPPPGARLIDARGHTLLPGLIDAHTHAPYSAVSGVSGDWGKNMRAYLYCGVTTLVDFGVYAEMFEPMRRLLASGAVPGPRVILASRITTPGGHGAEAGRGDLHSLEVLTPREGRAAVRRLLEGKPDAIKVFTDGWRYGMAPDMTHMEQDTLAAIVEEAHKNNLPVLTHTVTVARARIAARAGVDVIAHGLGDAEADPELPGLMRAARTALVPTLAVYEPRGPVEASPLLKAVLEPLSLAAVLARPGPPGSPAPRLRRWKTMLANTAALHRAGVAVGAGTDAGVIGTYHGWATLRELELLVEAGLTPVEAIAAATGVNARLLRLDRDRGVIAPGMIADLVLAEGEPHVRIGDIGQLRRVFLDGREVDRERLARDIASPAPSAIPPVRVARRIDDFERSDGRSLLDTLWVNSTDSGHDHTRMLFFRTLRAPGNHCLSVMARMAEKARPYARVSVPLARGGVQPADVSAFRGVQFQARGQGEYRLLVETRAVRDSAWHQAPFQAAARWRTIRVPFSALKQPATKSPAPWTGQDVTLLSFELAGPAAQNAWLELDDVRFWR